MAVKLLEKNVSSFYKALRREIFVLCVYVCEDWPGHVVQKCLVLESK